MFDGNWRKGVDKVVNPVGYWLNKYLKINANYLTFLGLGLSVGCMYFLSQGRFWIAFIFFVFTGLADLFDGSIAKAAGTISVRGAFFDSLIDRLADALILAGIAWYVLGAENHSDRLVFLPIGIAFVIQIISYQRAKAESLKLEAKSGLMERAERFFVLGFGIVFNQWLIQTLWVFLGLVSLTAIQRFIKIMRQSKLASKPD